MLIMFNKLVIAAAIASSQSTLIFGQDDTTPTNNVVDTDSIAIEVQNIIGDTCVTDFKPDDDIFPSKWVKPTIKTYGETDRFGDKFEPSVTTQYLDITYHNTYKIIYNKFKDVSYLLYQCGTEPPKEEVESGKHQMVIEVPHKGGLALTSTVQIPQIELLGLRREVKAYIGQTKWISSPCLKLMVENGEIESIDKNAIVAHGESNTETNELEDFLERNPNTIIIGGTGDDVTAPNTMIFTSSQEDTNVGNFDWMAFTAALYNKEEMSNRIANSAQQHFDCASENAYFLSSKPTERKLATTRRVAEKNDEDEEKTLLWANWIDGYGWSVAHCPHYQSGRECEWAAACNVKILSRPEGVGNVHEWSGIKYWYLNDEEFLDFAKDASHWIYSSQRWDNVMEKKGEEYLSQFKAYQSKRIWDTQGVDPNAWFEQRLAEYYVVGMDMCAVMGVDDGLHKSRWFRNIFTEQPGELGTCNPEDIDEPYVPPVEDCVPIAATLNAVGETVMGNDNAGALASTVQGLTLIASLAFAVSLW